jgi:type VI secretion system protein VasD
MRWDRRRLVLGGLGLLAACGGDPPPPPPPPTIVVLTLRGGPDVNPDAQGAAKPIAVRVFELASSGGFMAADFFSLDADPAGALGGDLLGQDSFVLAPGGTEVWQHELNPETRFVGVAAAYAQIDGAAWRAVFSPPPNETTLLLAELGARGVRLQPTRP